MEQIAHAIDEPHGWFFDIYLLERIRPKASFTGPNILAIHLLREPLVCFIDFRIRVVRFNPRDFHRVTIRATGARTGTANYWIPSFVSPFDACFHGSISFRFSITAILTGPLFTNYEFASIVGETQKEPKK